MGLMGFDLRESEDYIDTLDGAVKHVMADLEGHRDLIKDALTDYFKWYDEDELKEKVYGEEAVRDAQVVGDEPSTE